MTKPKQKTITERVQDGVAKALEENPSAHIHDCEFSAVKFDRTAVQSIEQIAVGLTENAKSLGELARIFSSVDVKFDAAIKISDTKNIEIMDILVKGTN